jgi:hypothetical protein
MTPSPIVASLAEQPAYYALYALYADYLANNARYAEREYFARLRDLVRFIQPLLGHEQPYMKSWSLRLFTERSALDRLPPEQVSAAWRLVRQMVEAIGAPAGWDGARPHRRAFRSLPRPARTPQDVSPARWTGRRSPVDYRTAV